MRPIKKYIAFILHPSSSDVDRQSFAVKIQSIIILLIFHVLIIIILSVLNSLLIHYGLIMPITNTSSWNSVQSRILLLLPLVLGPILEEISFRLWIGNAKYIPISFTVGFLVVNLFIRGFISIGSLIQNVPFLASSAIIYVFLTFLIKRSPIKVQQVNLYPRVSIFISAILFGFIHITHFIISKNVILLSPIIIMPFLIMGILYGYIRVKFGFGYAIATHVLYNVLAIINIFL